MENSSSKINLSKDENLQPMLKIHTFDVQTRPDVQNSYKLLYRIKMQNDAAVFELWIIYTSFILSIHANRQN